MENRGVVLRAVKEMADLDVGQYGLKERLQTAD
jgi:hypothetical protein